MSDDPIGLIEVRVSRRQQASVKRRYEVKGHNHVDTFLLDAQTVLMVFRRAEKTIEAARDGDAEE